MGSGGSKSKKEGSFDVGGQGAGQRDEQISASAAAGNPENSTPPTPTTTDLQGGNGVTAAGQTNSTTKQPAGESPGDQTAAMEKEDYVEAVVAKASEFGDNE